MDDWDCVVPRLMESDDWRWCCCARKDCRVGRYGLRRWGSAARWDGDGMAAGEEEDPTEGVRDRRGGVRKVIAADVVVPGEAEVRRELCRLSMTAVETVDRGGEAVNRPAPPAFFIVPCRPGEEEDAVTIAVVAGVADGEPKGLR